MKLAVSTMRFRETDFARLPRNLAKRNTFITQVNVTAVVFVVIPSKAAVAFSTYLQKPFVLRRGPTTMCGVSKCSPAVVLFIIDENRYGDCKIILFLVGGGGRKSKIFK